MKTTAKKTAKKAARRIKVKVAPLPHGRPTRRTPDVDARIIEGLSNGTPLTIICAPDDMPCCRAVRNWANADDEFYSAIARARELGFDAIAAEALRIADTPLIGEEVTDSEDGRTIKKSDMLGHRKLQVETRLKLLAKWDPKRYGERLAQEISGPNGAPVSVSSMALNTEQEQALSRVIADAQERVRRIP